MSHLISCLGFVVRSVRHQPRGFRRRLLVSAVVLVSVIHSVSAQLCFEADTTPSGPKPISVKHADLDGDGDVDLVGVTSSAVWIFFGRGAGTFSSPVR